MKLNLNDIINECQEHIALKDCEGCPFGGPDGECLPQHSPVSWNLEFLNTLLDKHFDEQNQNIRQVRQDGKHINSTIQMNHMTHYMQCVSHRHINGLSPLPEPSIESICERDCTVYLTCPLLKRSQIA